MNVIPSNKKPVYAEIYGVSPSDGRVAMSTDIQDRPILKVDAAQTIAAADFNIRNLNGSTDSSIITAADFAIRALDGSRDGVTAYDNSFFVTSGTATILLGGTTVLQVDTSPYSSSAFLVRADALALLATVSLQLSPVDNPASYFTTVASEGNLILGGRYLFVPPVPLRYARIFGTGVGARFTAYYVGQI